MGLSRERLVHLGTAAAVLVAWQLVQHDTAVLALLIAVGVLMFGGLLYTMLVRCDSTERARLMVVGVLMAVSVVFWAFFEQAGSSINLFTDRNVDREVYGSAVPASMFQSVNPAYIIMLAPIFATAWVALARRGREPSTPTKFALGVTQLGLGFGALFVGAAFADARGLVGLSWLFLGYLLHTTGELCLSPVGLSMVTKLSPARMTGWVMGCWFLSTAYAQYIAGLIAMLTGVSAPEGQPESLPPPTETVMVYGSVFGKLALVAIGVGALLFVFVPALKRRMHGIR